MNEAEIIDFKLFLHFLQQFLCKNSFFIFTTVLLDDCGLNSSGLEVASINIFKLRFEKSEQKNNNKRRNKKNKMSENKLLQKLSKTDLITTF